MTITVSFKLNSENPIPKWVKVLDALVLQHGGKVTVTRRGGAVVSR